ncbi:MAG: hypothetical protein ACQEXX_04920 [Bacillota bacterium]
MNALELILAFFVLMVLFGIMNMTINYITRRDGEEPVPLRVKLWLIPMLSVFIIVPIALFSALFTIIFQMDGEYRQVLSYESLGSLFSFSLVILLGFLLFESLIHPISIALLRLWVRRDVSVYAKQSVTIITDTFILYFISLIIPGVHISGLLGALSIAVFYHIIEWELMGVQTWIQYRKRKRYKLPG